MSSVNISLPPPEPKGEEATVANEHTSRQTPPPQQQNNAPPPPGQYNIPPGQNMPHQQYMQNNPQPMQYGSQQQQYNNQQQYYQQQPMPQQQYQQQMPQQQYAQPMPQQQYAQPQQYQYAQPMPSPMMGQSPTPFLTVPVQPWTTGLFDCANDLENALITLFCPCITFGQIAEITDRGMSTCMSAGLIYTLLLSFTGFHWIYSWMYRTRLRTLYSLQEDPCHDCLVHFFCDACALCQEYRELQNRGFNMQLRWVGNVQLQAQNGATTNAPPPAQGMTR